MFYVALSSFKSIANILEQWHVEFSSSRQPHRSLLQLVQLTMRVSQISSRSPLSASDQVPGSSRVGLGESS